jgi:micrococcal nuclease
VFRIEKIKEKMKLEIFWQRNKTFIAIIIAALIISGTIYFSENSKINKNLSSKVEEEKGFSEEVAEKEISNKRKFFEANLSKEPKCFQMPLLEDNSFKKVTKIIDGDTFLIEGGYSVRILGIDADEREKPCYLAAKKRLEELILNKEVKLEKSIEDKDQWCRYLRYVFVDNKNIGEELIKEGLVVARLSPQDTKYQKEIIAAEKESQEKKIGCKWSFQNQVEATHQKKNFFWEKLNSELTGLKIVNACDSKNYYGKELIVEGKIVQTFRSKTNTVFLNFEKPYPEQCFSAVIFNSSQKQFGPEPEKYYLNKTVRIKGVIKKYQGKPEIILKNPNQIEVGK